jgi:hypothetical protein
VGRGIALGFQAFQNNGLSAQGAGSHGVSPPGGSDTTKIYSPDLLAAIMGFSGIWNVGEVQPIWTTFQMTKNVDVLVNDTTCSTAWRKWA